MNRRHFVRSSVAAAVAASLPVDGALATILGPSSVVDADIHAVTGDGAEVTLKRAAVQELGDSLRGDLLLPGHEAYEQARRIRNASISKYPALIVQPKGVADIRNAVDFARESNLLIAVKCGGHSHSGKSTCNGGMMIDLSRFRSVHVDPAGKIAHVSGGSLLGDMDHETMAFGLVTTAGTVSHTGVGGLTLGGGFGRLARRFGLSLDNVRSYEIVTPDGKFRRADVHENADLYWGLRGGGGNFGVVTSFEFGLHEMQREVIGGLISFPLDQARQVLEFYAEYSLEAPDELQVDPILLSNGLATRELRGTPGGDISFAICYTGPHKKAESILNRVRSAGKPIADMTGVIDYVALQKSGDENDVRALGNYTKSGLTAELTPEFIDAIVEGFEARAGRFTLLGFQQCGGAIGRVAADATAFPHRNVNYVPILNVRWQNGIDPAEHIAWLKNYWATIDPHIQGFYTNDLIDETQEEVNRNYLGNYQRLVALKTKYDPTNLFRLNANILPTTS